MTPHPHRYGWLVLNGYAGYTRQRVAIVGETEKKMRIRALMRTRLGGRKRWLSIGDETLVPRHAVELDNPERT